MYTFKFCGEFHVLVFSSRMVMADDESEDEKVRGFKEGQPAILVSRD